MIYRDFQGLSLSLLGFGTMRLPTTAAGDVDTAEVRRIYSGSASSAACPVSPLQTSFLPGFLLS